MVKTNKNKFFHLHYNLVKLKPGSSWQLSCCCSQTIEINSIENYYGFAVVEQGTLDYPIEYKYHILTVNKTYLDLTYDNLIEQYNSKEYYQTDTENILH